jgi:hypothetical protein
MITVFRKYPTQQQAEDTLALLTRHRVPASLVVNNAVGLLDANFLGSPVINKYEVKIAPVDFERAEKILAAYVAESMENIEEDYYLYTFSEEELYEVLTNADEWSEYDYQLAQTILRQRGKPVLPEQLVKLKKQRLAQLAHPEPNQRGWIIAGYIFAALGGLLGIFIGYHIWTSRKILPNGEQVYSYQETDRKHGKTIFVLALIVAIPALLYRLYKLLL